MSNQAGDTVQAAAALGHDLGQIVQALHLRVLLPGACGLQPRFDEFEVGQDECEGIVDLVGDTSGQDADARHLLHLHELLARLVDAHQACFEIAPLGQKARVGFLELPGPLAHVLFDFGVQAFEILEEPRVLLDQALVLNGAHDGQAQGLDGLVLDHVVEGALMDGTQDLAGARHRGQHDDRRVDRAHAQGCEQLDARHFRHIEFGDDDIERPLGDCRQSRARAADLLDLETPVGYQPAHEVAYQRAVIDEQNPSWNPRRTMAIGSRYGDI
jgi:hypothetical protein